MGSAQIPQLLNRLRMRQVALLLAIGRHGTLRAAAAALGMTQPAASKMLQELEHAMGHPLFERVGRGLRLTEGGRCVMGHFQGLQGSLDALTRELDGIAQGGAGKLHIGSIMAASPELLSSALLTLKQRYPLLSVEITIDTSDRLTESLRRGDLDLVIGRVPEGAMDDMDFRPVADEALSVVAHPDHPLAGRSRVTFNDLLQHPWILQPRGSPMRDVLEQEFRRHRATVPRGLIETSSILTTMNLLARSDMIAVIPAEVATRYEAHRLLACLRYTVRQQLGVFGCLTARGRPASQPMSELLGLLTA
ncbi:MAG: LysR family transcriptional regulator [Hydrogenophaga sp.]|jgi:molybdate transport repressor ModE-like protein|nr:LysR family transcriptional regulator [Hydrogenophaga sp.]